MSTEKIRNVVLVGHGGTGKTSLSEALLFAAGVINRMGRVEDGNTVSDFEQEEVDRKISLSLSMTPFAWNGYKINVIDTPGFAAFVGETKAALRAADLALLVVSAADGVEVQHEILWRMAEEEGIARAILVNKLDRERASYADTLAQIREKFGTGVAPLHVPIGEEAGFNGLVDVVANRAWTYDGKDAKGSEGDVPGDLQDEVESIRSEMIEPVVEADDELLERYLEGVEPTVDELAGALRKGIVAGTTHPVLVASATRLIGLDRLVEFLVTYAPNPSERTVPPLAEGESLPSDAPVAYVFKTISDPYMGRVSLFRMFSGNVAIDQELVTANGSQGGGRMHNVFALRGKEHEDIKGLEAGDIAAVAKIESIGPGDTLVSPGTKVKIAPVQMPKPVMSLAIFPKTQSDEEKLSNALHKIIESDPTLAYERRGDTNESVISGLGDTHLEVAVKRMATRYGVEVETRTPTVPYREAITRSAEVEGKHKKQSGGRGQYGVAWVRFEPNTRGEGYEYVDNIVGGSIPKQLIPAVDKGIQEALQRGMIAGFPVVDVKATVYDGKFHAVDSDELSFRMAGINAVKAAAEKAGPVLLEPLYKARISVPEENMGDVMGDINSKRGQVLGMEVDGDMQVVNAMVPLAEMQRYSIELRSITGGRGTFEMEFDHYAEMPPQEQAKVVEAAKAAADN